MSCPCLSLSRQELIGVNELVERMEATCDQVLNIPVPDDRCLSLSHSP